MFCVVQFINKKMKRDVVKKYLIPLVSLVLLIIGIWIKADDRVYKMNAPTKNLEIHFWLNSEGTPEFKVLRNDCEIIRESALGLITTFEELNKGFKIKSIDKSFVDTNGIQL